MFPNEKVVFEIPIYFMPEKEFEKRWDKKRKEYIDWSLSLRNSEEDAKANFHYSFYPQNVWKYNQIIGFVEIAIAPMDIVLNVYKTLDKKMYADSGRKHFIQNLYSNGSHFPIGKKSNEEIVIEIDSWLASIGKDLPNKMCLDLDTYSTVKKHIDFRGIWEDIVKSVR